MVLHSQIFIVIFLLLLLQARRIRVKRCVTSKVGTPHRLKINTA